jgi:hypothetical protein
VLEKRADEKTFVVKIEALKEVIEDILSIKK